MLTWIFLFPVVLSALIAAVLISCHKYEDGLFGRISLGGIALAGLFIALHVLEGGAQYDVDLDVLLFVWASTIFLVRHALRFVWFTRSKEALG